MAKLVEDKIPLPAQRYSSNRPNLRSLGALPGLQYIFRSDLRCCNCSPAAPSGAPRSGGTHNRYQPNRTTHDNALLFQAAQFVAFAATAASVRTRVVSRNVRQRMNDSVARDALVIPSGIAGEGSPTLPFASSSRLAIDAGVFQPGLPPSGKSGTTGAFDV